MKPAPPSSKARAIAEYLLTYEAGAANSVEANPPAAFRVSEKLRRPLSTLVGATGFRALLARSLMLAKAQHPGLCTVDVKPDGSLEGLNELRGERGLEAGALSIA